MTAVDERDGLAGRFETQRGALMQLAYRMLGSRSEAEDAVQEGWLRLAKSDLARVENLASWLRTLVSRVCLDMLRTRVAAGGARRRPAARRARGPGPRPRTGGAIARRGGSRLAHRAGRAGFRGAGRVCAARHARRAVRRRSRRRSSPERYGASPRSAQPSCTGTAPSSRPSLPPPTRGDLDALVHVGPRRGGRGPTRAASSCSTARAGPSLCTRPPAGRWWLSSSAARASPT